MKQKLRFLLIMITLFGMTLPMTSLTTSAAIGGDLCIPGYNCSGDPKPDPDPDPFDISIVSVSSSPVKKGSSATISISFKNTGDIDGYVKYKFKITADSYSDYTAIWGTYERLVRADQTVTVVHTIASSFTYGADKYALNVGTYDIGVRFYDSSWSSWHNYNNVVQVERNPNTEIMFAAMFYDDKWAKRWDPGPHAFMQEVFDKDIKNLENDNSFSEEFNFQMQIKYSGRWNPGRDNPSNTISNLVVKAGDSLGLTGDWDKAVDNTDPDNHGFDIVFFISGYHGDKKAGISSGSAFVATSGVGIFPFTKAQHKRLILHEFLHCLSAGDLTEGDYIMNQNYRLDNAWNMHPYTYNAVVDAFESGDYTT